MNIIIAGAGDVGFHLAELLAIENQNIILIDTDEALLQYAVNHLDVLTIKGDVTSLAVLEKADVNKAHLFIAVTTLETTNMLACILAKRMGARKTIARIKNSEYLEDNQKEYFQQLGINNMISPLLLGAQEIERLVRRVSATDVFDFDDGKLSIIGMTADSESRLVGKSFHSMENKNPEFLMRTVAILRDGMTIIPEGDMQIESGDHLYLATNEQSFEPLNRFAGKSLKKLKKIMIIGGTEIALETAKILEHDYAVTIVIRDEEVGKKFISELDDAMVVHADESNIEQLREEGLERMDAFIALTPNSGNNIVASLTAEKFGVSKTIAHVDNAAYTHISQDIGVDTLINKKLLAANDIFKFIRKGKVEAIVSLHGVQAEIIEFVLHRNNRVVHVPLSQLHLPKDAKIVGVIRADEGLIPNDNFQLEVDDKVIVFVLPSAIKVVESIFH